MNTRKIHVGIRALMFLAMAISAAGGAWAQHGGDFLPAQRLRQYSSLFLGEKIYLHTDKTTYLAGEIIWFKAYAVDGHTHEPVSRSKVAYVELLDRSAKAVLQAKIGMTASGGSGSFYLPVSLPSDHYVLRAYTNLMKNAGNPVFFEKNISVINTTRATPQHAATASGAPDIRFFPEGGYLVEGIESKLGFRLTGAGDGPSTGMLTSQDGDTVLHFKIGKSGIGHFAFTPSPGKNYSAVISIAGHAPFRKPLPAARESGYVLNITDNGDARYRVKIHVKKKSPAEGTGDLFLLVHCRQSIKQVIRQTVVNDAETTVYIEKEKLGEGVNHVTLFNGHQPVCERLLYSKPASPVKGNISSGKSHFDRREEVRVLAAVPNDSFNCSVAVYKLDSFGDSQDLSMADYLFLASELQGTDGYSFTHGTDAGYEMDDLMLTKGWRRFRWDEVLNRGAAPALKFSPEIFGHTVMGRVVNTTTGNPVADADGYLSVPSEPFGFYIARSDHLGIARFNVRNYFGPGEAVTQVSDVEKSKYRLDLVNPFSEEALASPVPSFTRPVPSYAKEILQRSIAMQAQNIYVADSIRKFSMPVLADSLPFYGRAEYSYFLDTYKRFTTMEEVLREYVILVNVLLRNGKLQMSVYDDANRQVYHDNILVLLDGVPLTDYNKIFSYDPLKIRKLDVVPRRYYYGQRMYSGIVSFQTYDGRFDGFDLDPSLVAIDYEGLQLQREFYSPQYDDASRPSRVPDFRTTLYWTPDVKVGAASPGEIRFFTSDQPGTYRVVVEGLSNNGTPMSGIATFIVR